MSKNIEKKTSLDSVYKENIIVSTEIEKDYKTLLNPPVEDAQLVFSFKRSNKLCDQFHIQGSLEYFSWIWDEEENLEPNPCFWFGSVEDLLYFVRKAPKKEVVEILQKEIYFK